MREVTHRSIFLSKTKTNCNASLKDAPTLWKPFTMALLRSPHSFITILTVVIKKSFSSCSWLVSHFHCGWLRGAHPSSAAAGCSSAAAHGPVWPPPARRSARPLLDFPWEKALWKLTLHQGQHRLSISVDRTWYRCCDWPWAGSDISRKAGYDFTYLP